MTLKRATLIAMLVATCPTWASPEPQAKPQSPRADVLATKTAPKANQAPPRGEAEHQAAPVANAPQPEGGLIARKPIQKRAANDIVIPAEPNGRIIVKFRDDVQARVTNQGALRSAKQNVDLRLADGLVRERGLHFEPAFKMSQQRINSIQSRAAAQSGKAQPDLAGMVYVIAPNDNPDALLQMARMLNDLPEVEFAELDQHWRVPEFLGGFGACCVPTNGVVNCVDGLSETVCDNVGGVYQGDGSNCGIVFCNPTLGACCIAENECETLTEAQCDGVGGFFRGIGTNCTEPGVCELQGACCVPGDGDVVCVPNVTEDLCNEELCGFYLGDFTECPVECDLGIGACCIASECVALTEGECLAEQGIFWGPGINCCNPIDLCEEPGCGVLHTGSCFECHTEQDNPVSGGRFCNNAECCSLVCSIDPFCCEEDADPTYPGRGAPHWDSNCVALALLLCADIAPPGSVCESPLNGPCFEEHGTPGCNNNACCVTVCSVEPFCCEGQWDQICVGLAFDLCAVPTSDTPNFSDAQGYLTPLSYITQWGKIPFNVSGSVQQDPCALAPTFIGWNGIGWNLQALWEFGELIRDLNNFPQNYTRGKTIRVGVIEHTAFVNWEEPEDPAFTHEDLAGKVIPEPKQTQIIWQQGSPEFSGNHGTACLGIIGAIDHGVKGHKVNEAFDEDSGEIGMVGIAPEAELYFFPITSVEEGGRLLNAWGNALDTFEPGDVLSFSIGPGGCGTLLTSQSNWMMARIGSDLGIVTCIAAGNSCCNIDANGQLGGAGDDSDAIIVGAVTPGAPFCRAGFSNYCVDCDFNINAVHIAAWGEGVATLGYGNLFMPEGNTFRSYTNTFNGTSAACPQIAALVANLQGLSKMMYGVPLTPIQMRSILNAGWRECGFLSAADIPGPVNQQFACLGDFDPSADPARVCGEGDPCVSYPVAELVAENVAAGGFFDGNDLIDEIIVIRGNKRLGNIFSITSNDQSYFVVDSLYTLKKHKPNLSGPPGKVTYMAAAQTVDLAIRGHAPISQVTGISIATDIQAPGPSSLLFIEMYDWDLNRWQFVNFTPLEGNADVLSVHEVSNPTRFVHDDNLTFYIRVYVMSLGTQLPVGFDEVSNGEFTLRVDLVGITITTGFGGNPGEGGGIVVDP